MILGITGGFGSGKSSVLRFFASRSWFVMDADSVCRSFYENKEPELMDCLRDNFGSGIFDTNGFADRRKLGEILFRAPEKMDLITRVIYPMLTEKIHQAINECREKKQNGAFELPLLYEAGFENCFDKVLAVWIPADLRKKRLLGRNFSPDEVDRRDRMQMPPDEKLERADFGVINSGTADELFAQLTTIAEKLENSNLHI